MDDSILEKVLKDLYELFRVTGQHGENIIGEECVLRDGCFSNPVNQDIQVHIAGLFDGRSCIGKFQGMIVLFLQVHGMVDDFFEARSILLHLEKSDMIYYGRQAITEIVDDEMSEITQLFFLVLQFFPCFYLVSHVDDRYKHGCTVTIHYRL